MGRGGEGMATQDAGELATQVAALVDVVALHQTPVTLVRDVVVAGRLGCAGWVLMGRFLRLGRLAVAVGLFLGATAVTVATAAAAATATVGRPTMKSVGRVG